MGDACVGDFDGDGVPDDDDVCPHVKHLSKTSFLKYFTVDLYSGHSDPAPEWRVGARVSCSVHPGSLSLSRGHSFWNRSTRPVPRQSI